MTLQETTTFKEIMTLQETTAFKETVTLQETVILHETMTYKIDLFQTREAVLVNWLFDYEAMLY
jgi:hypothetical protein